MGLFSIPFELFLPILASVSSRRKPPSESRALLASVGFEEDFYVILLFQGLSEIVENTFQGKRFGCTNGCRVTGCRRAGYVSDIRTSDTCRALVSCLEQPRIWNLFKNWLWRSKSAKCKISILITSWKSS